MLLQCCESSLADAEPCFVDDYDVDVDDHRDQSLHLSIFGSFNVQIHEVYEQRIHGSNGLSLELSDYDLLSNSSNFGLVSGFFVFLPHLMSKQSQSASFLMTVHRMLIDLPTHKRTEKSSPQPE